MICTATRRLCGLRKDQLREDELVRIALIAPPWLPVPPPSYGGVEAVVDRLARGFDAAGDATAAGARLRMVQDGLTGFVRDRPEDLVESCTQDPGDRPRRMPEGCGGRLLHGADGEGSPQLLRGFGRQDSQSDALGPAHQT